MIAIAVVFPVPAYYEVESGGVTLAGTGRTRTLATGTDRPAWAES